MSAPGATEPLHTTRFPNESDEYRSARDALLREEIALRRQSEARRNDPPLLEQRALLRTQRPGACTPGHVDFIWPLWSVFDCTPEGRGTDWYPRLAYG
jgi:predicted dithiol-disulfide oxidoreductase (DUF899 family)